MITESNILEAINKLHLPFGKSRNGHYQQIREEAKEQIRFIKEDLSYDD